MPNQYTEPKTINWDEVEKLISYQNTQEEVASWFNISVDTLERLCLRDKGIMLTEFWKKKKLYGRVKLRKAQMDLVEKGGPGAATMGIWLGKVILGQGEALPDDDPDRQKQLTGSGENGVRDVTPALDYKAEIRKAMEELENEY